MEQREPEEGFTVESLQAMVPHLQEAKRQLARVTGGSHGWFQQATLSQLLPPEDLRLVEQVNDASDAVCEALHIIDRLESEVGRDW